MLSITGIFAQFPHAINFQAIARDANGFVMEGTPIQIRLTIIDGSATGTDVYQELRALTTNDYGSFSFQIGRDANYVTIGTFDQIDWNTGAKFLKIDYDPTNQFNWNLTLGTIEFVSVPFALSAETVSFIDASNAQDGDVLVYNSATGMFEPQQISASNYTAGSGISISGNTISATDNSTTNELQTLSLSGASLSISNGNSVILPTGTTYTAGTGISISGNTITNSGDLSSSNEIQVLNLSGSSLSLSNGGGSVTLPTGTTYTAGTGISISGNTITNNGDLSSSNEIQTLNLSGNSLSLSNGGGSVTLPSGTSQWTTSGSNIYYNLGNIGIGTNTPFSKLNVNGQLSIGNTNIAGGDMSGLPFSLNDGSSAFWIGPYDGGTATLADYGVIYAEYNNPNSSTEVYRLNIVTGDNATTTSGGLDIFEEIFVGNCDYVTTEKNGLTVKGGNVGIGIQGLNPTSKLQVVGLSEYSNNSAAISAGLTVGAFYHTAGVLKVVY